jgi:type II secretory pathway predicted ATPase ExeA
MYEAHFGLSQRPFASMPRPDCYYPGTAIEAARQTLIRCIGRAEGVGVVLGPSGTGKTLLCQLLVEQFKNTFQTVHLSSGRLSTRRALFQAILFGLGQPYRGMDEGELRLALVDYLTQSDKCEQGMLLLVDEAHTLPLRLLDEIRMLTNLTGRGQPCMRLVLVGASALEERLASPKLESFSQRIVARCYLESFNREETEQYIQSQMTGPASRVFSSDACQAVHQATDGVPRLVNQVCDHALLLAFTRGGREVGRGEIEEAWADLQQLPTPWNGSEAGAKAEGNIIEFGGLTDDVDDDASQAARPTEQLALRLTPSDDGLAPDPAEQVATIQQALSAADDDFQPAGSIGPEMELVFDDLNNPFAEEFEEEELVVERYKMLCRSSQEASPMIFTRSEAEQLQALHAETNHLALAAQQQATEPEPASSSAESKSRKPGASEGTAPQTVPLRPEPAAAERRDDEENMIVVEEGYEEYDLPHTRPLARARRQEYRQLFAHLRRNG